MRKVLLILALLLALSAIAIGAEWTRERLSRYPSDMRTFDSVAIGKLDTDMWRSYYERRPVRQAMDLRDGKGAAITEADWQRIGEMLAASWKSLYDAVQTPY